MASFLVLYTSLGLLEPSALVSRPAVRAASAAPPALGRRGLLEAAVAATGGLAALGGLPAASWAEATLTTRQQAYTRYVPRIERGRDFWASGLRRLVQAKDWAAISKELEKKGAIDRAFGPMELWSSSWSSKTISDKTLAMNEAVLELKEAAAALSIAATGKEKGGGFFGFGGDKVRRAARRRRM